MEHISGAIFRFQYFLVFGWDFGQNIEIQQNVKNVVKNMFDKIFDKSGIWQNPLTRAFTTTDETARAA